MTKSANTIRTEFIEFFKSKSHRFVPSSPVVPQDDPTLLFTNAGMNQFKSIFLGENREGLTRAANSQKCMRVSGKHNDLEEVGVDHHHHTFFEMLGNWSFGDYYKKEAIAWAWELLTEVWGLPKDKLYATVFEDDSEAEELWKTETDIAHERIGRHGAKANFWEMGETGPCGPCSEIHLDSGPGTCINEHTPGHVCAVNADGCGRYIEIWNLVFMQYNREPDGSLHELPAKHVDTGMGFERITRIIQNVKSNYATDVFMPIIHAIEKKCGKTYDPGPAGTPFRVIADHIRALVFAITDGAFPSNEGRGYVLRRLLRRAYRFGRNLGFTGPFLDSLVPVVIEVMGDAFPEVTQRRDYVMQIIRSEEERFDQTLEQGLDKIGAMMDKCRKAGETMLNGADIFMLYDTYGFPMDLTRLIASEQGLTIDESGFETLMQSQRERARDAAKSGVVDGLTSDGWIELKPASGTTFVGFDQDEASVSVCRYKILHTADAYLLILDTTPFYAEMGGQVGDTGTLTLADGTQLTVTDTIKWNDMTVHKVSATAPFPLDNFSKPITARIQSTDRMHTKRNHSATHLLQAALIQVLGTHVSQSGSRVGPDGLRFDFTHFKALTPEEIVQVEDIVNDWILADLPIATTISTTDEAKKEGAIALFGEKYGESVRVVAMGPVSKELCGGTHVSSTGNIGQFHIVAESSIAAGIRRIEAVTGIGSLRYFRAKEQTVAGIMNALKVNEENILTRVTDITGKMKELETTIAKLSQASAGQEVEKLIGKTTAADKGSFPWIVENLGVLDKKQFTDLIDAVSDTIRKNGLKTTLVFCAAQVDNKALFAACAGNDAVSLGVHCGELVKTAAQCAGGGGGGSPTRAQAGGKQADKIAESLQAVETLIRKKAGVA